MGRYIRRVLFVALVCLVFVGVNNANLGIVSQLASQNDNEWIGPLSIALIFLGSGTGALYHEYMHKYTYNKIIFIGSLGWDLYVTFSVIFLFIGFESYIIAIIIVGSMISGLTASTFYNGVFNYVNQCGKRDSRTKQYFGISLCIQQTANLLGGGLSSIFIEPLGQKNYSLMMLGLSITSSILFIFVKNFKQPQKNSLILQNSNQNLPIQEKTPQKEQKQSLLTIDQYNQDKKVPYLLFFCFSLSGVMINFVFAVFSILFYRYYPEMDKEELNYFTFIAFMIQGCGQFLGGLTIALFSRKISNVLVAYVSNGVLFIIMTVLIFLGFQNNIVALIYISSFVIGFCDCFCFSLACSIGGIWKQSGISLFNAGQSVTVALLSIPTIFLSFPWMILIYSIILLIATFALWKHREALKEIHLEYQ